MPPVRGTGADKISGGKTYLPNNLGIIAGLGKRKVNNISLLREGSWFTVAHGNQKLCELLRDHLLEDQLDGVEVGAVVRICPGPPKP